MWKYILKRIFYFIPTILGISIIVFALIRFIPGDPVEIMLGEHPPTPEQREYYMRYLGLDKPIYVQFFVWIRRMLLGDWGVSLLNRMPIRELVFDRWINTLRLAIISMVIVTSIGILLGVISGYRVGTRIDKISRFLGILGWSAPSFLKGLILILTFSLYLGLFPSFGYGGLAHLILPSITLSLGGIAYISRITRGSMLEIAVQDYIKTAIAKGLRRRTILFRHILKNALLPVVTMLGGQFGWFLSGSFIIETIFAFPGIGRLTIQGIETRDYPIVQGCVFFISIIYCAINLIVDITYVYLDPRIRYGRKS